jgi:hypothetical protein
LGAGWPTDLPARIWVINVEPGACTPHFCQAALKVDPYLAGVRYTHSQSGRQLHLKGSVSGCDGSFERVQALDELERSSWQARYEQMWGEMLSEMQIRCTVSVPSNFSAVTLRLMLVGDHR